MNALLSTDTTEATHLKIQAVPKCMQMNHLWFTLSFFSLLFFFFSCIKAVSLLPTIQVHFLPLTLWSLFLVSTGPRVQEMQSALSSVQFSRSVLS